MASNMKGPPDGGWGWMCVLGKLLCFFVVLGTPSAFGIIYIDLIDYFSTTRETAAWIGSLTTGLTHLAGPLSSILTAKFGIQKTIAAGTLMAFTGCFMSFFATGIPYLYVSYGVIMGVGLGVMLVPCMLIVVQYFKRRLVLANAIGSTGTGLGTLVLPPLYTYLLEQYGWRGTMVLLSGFILNGLVCAVIFIPPKVSEKVSTSEIKTSASCWKFLRFFCNPGLVLYTIGMMFAFLGYIVPYVHLPDMAVQKGIDNGLVSRSVRKVTMFVSDFGNDVQEDSFLSQAFEGGIAEIALETGPHGTHFQCDLRATTVYRAAYLISVMGVSNIIGRLVFGWIGDFRCVNVIFLQGLSLMVCGVVTAVCPHLNEFYGFAAYSVIYGAFVGVFLSLLPVAVLLQVGLDRTGDVLGVIIFLLGIMDMVASPLAGWLFDLTKTYNISFYVAACPLFLAGVLKVVVMFLHRRQMSQTKEDNVSAQTVSQPSMNETQYSDTLERTHM